MKWPQRISAPAAIAVFAVFPSAFAAPMTRAEVRQRVEALTALGKALFVDPRLSPSGRLACASCHSPENALSGAAPLAPKPRSSRRRGEVKQGRYDAPA